MKKVAGSSKRDSESIRRQVENLIKNFEEELRTEDLRQKVLAMVPIFKNLRDLGKSLMSEESASSARDRILHYFQKYPQTVIDGDELLVVSGIQEYARRIRELRVQFGWSIASGMTFCEIEEADGLESVDSYQTMKPSQYVLLSTDQDRESAHRWNVANTIRKEDLSVRDKILAFFRQNIGQEITGEELRYVAGNKSEWARRVRELRTECGWHIATKTTGRPDLGVSIYVLESDRQSPEHDRDIPDEVRREVLRKAGYKCETCGWTRAEWNADDPRHLELHHIRHHAAGGENTAENLQVLCQVHHDAVHRQER